MNITTMRVRRKVSIPKSFLCVLAFALCFLYLQMVVDKKSTDVCIQPERQRIMGPPDIRNHTTKYLQKQLLRENETDVYDWNKADDKVNNSHGLDHFSKTTEKPFNNNPMAKMFTFAEFIQKAQNEEHFLTKILSQTYLHSKSPHVLRRYFTGKEYSFEPEFKNVSLRKDYDVHYDVMVFLHIQKTGGMHLNDRIIRELAYPFKCKCGFKEHTCPCLNPKGNIWLYTSKLSGWPCGLHADWTQLHRCIPNQIEQMEQRRRHRRYFYFTQLRDPIARYMSEYFHQSFIAGHWQDALLGCGTGFAEWIDIRPCFLDESWRGVTLQDFMMCKYNLASNRMTRMLADLTLSDCYADYTNRNKMRKRAYMWLDSAKANLQKMEYFGIMENKEWSDMLFSSVFHMGFKNRQTRNVRSRSSEIRMTESQFLRLVRQVELDIHLYLFAKDLFERRLRTMKG